MFMIQFRSGATAICSDKTGTLTENRMTVVEGWFHGKRIGHTPSRSELDDDVAMHIILNSSLNSKATLHFRMSLRRMFLGLFD